jgi:hypothetical protein
MGAGRAFIRLISRWCRLVAINKIRIPISSMPRAEGRGKYYYWAVVPPSITSSDPVTKEDSSDAR